MPDKISNRDNTLIVVWGDHVWHHGEKQHLAKAVLWEEAARAPLYWVKSGVTKAGEVCNRAADFLSIFPTHCELAGTADSEKCVNASLRPSRMEENAPCETREVAQRDFLGVLGFRNSLIADGGWGRNRTADTRIFSPLLYQLSYPASPSLIPALRTKQAEKARDPSPKAPELFWAFSRQAWWQRRWDGLLDEAGFVRSKRELQRLSLRG